MIKNLFQCPIELFEAYPIGRILNRLSCDMYVVDQVDLENIMFSSVSANNLQNWLKNFSETSLLCPEISFGDSHLSFINCCQLYPGNFWWFNPSFW